MEKNRYTEYIGLRLIIQKTKILQLISMSFLCLLISCDANDHRNFEIPFVQLDADEYSGVCPDDILCITRGSVRSIEIQYMKEDSVTSDSYKYNENGRLVETKIYSDGDYYIVKYHYKGNLLISKTEFLGDKILHSFLFDYTKRKDGLCTVSDDKGNTIGYYQIIVTKDNIKIIRLNEISETISATSFLYHQDKITEIIVDKPRVGVRFRTELSYADERLNKLTCWDESNLDKKLFYEKEYEYTEDGALKKIVTNTMQEDIISSDEKDFIEIDQYNNWLSCTLNGSSEPVIKRKIFYY